MQSAKPYMVKFLREQFPPGTRVRLDSAMNDPQPIPTGMTGTVQGVDDAGQLFMKWDNGRGLSLVPGEDDFSVVKPQKLKLYMPLGLGYYEKNDWGDYEDEELALSDSDAVGYVDAPDKSSGKRKQKVHIEYDLVGYIPVDELRKAEQA